jgi:hypothetical protein
MPKFGRHTRSSALTWTTPRSEIIMAVVTGNSCLQLDMRERPSAPDALVPPGGGGLGGVTTAAAYMPEPEVGRARTDGLLAVIQAFACRVGVFGYDATRHDKFLIMVAARPVLDALDLLLPSIAMQMEAAARTAARAYGEEVRSALPDLPDVRKRSVLRVPYFRNYLRGFGQGRPRPSKRSAPSSSRPKGTRSCGFWRSRMSGPRRSTAKSSRIQPGYGRSGPATSTGSWKGRTPGGRWTWAMSTWPSTTWSSQ